MEAQLEESGRTELFSCRRARGIGSNWWAQNCNLSTFLKRPQSSCAPICTGSLCKIKPSWMPAGAAKCLQLPVGSVPATVWPKSHGPSGAGLFVLTAFYLLNSTQLQQDFLLLCLALTSHFTFKTKQNVPGRIKHFPQSPVWLWYPIMSARQMFARCADTSYPCWT